MLQELGIDCEAITVNLAAGEHRRLEFLKINPAGKVPVLVDGDFVLTESVAILLYLAEKYLHKGLAPTDLKQKAQVNRYGVLRVTRLFTQNTCVFLPRFPWPAKISRTWQP